MKLSKTLREVFSTDYVIPLYQRNFAWGAKEIELLLQDIYESKKNERKNYYIGTLVLSKDKAHEVVERHVIDGQQRLTALSLIFKILDPSFSKNHLNYKSRNDVKEFLKSFYECKNKSEIISLAENPYKIFSGKTEKENAKLDHFSSAIFSIYESKLDVTLENSPTIANLSENELKELKEYFENNVILLTTYLPDDTDVAAYFEIMNNRGEQLKREEIVKSLLMNKVEESKQGIFAAIWEACSQMEIPIQKCFDISNRKLLFGTNYDECHIENITKVKVCDYKRKAYSLDDIVDGNIEINMQEKSDDIEEENDDEQKTYSPIIDFPNFILQVLKIYSNNKGLFKDINSDKKNDTKNLKTDDISLDEKYLIREYERIQNKHTIDGMDFISYLLFYRVCLDRFVVMTKDKKNQKNEDDFNWVLHKPVVTISENGKRNFHYVESFAKNEKGNYTSTELQEELEKVLSMLQVTFRTRKNKHWLTKALSFFNLEDCDIRKYGGESKEQLENGKEYLLFLKNIILEYYKENYPLELNGRSFMDTGTNTPHFLFNFIDLLYYEANIKSEKIISLNLKTELLNEIKKVRDFDFRYYNSVEHHLAQSRRNNDNKEWLDSLGNLCLISKRANSQNSDTTPFTKATDSHKYDLTKLTPKRAVMYSTTVNNKKWYVAEIEEHYNCVIELLNNAERILFL